MPQGQSTSDNRIKDLILGHFFADNFNKVIELSFELRVMDSRSLALILYSRSMLDQDISKSDNYEILRREFKDINWDQTVDRFHIPNKDLNDKLISYMKSI